MVLMKTPDTFLKPDADDPTKVSFVMLTENGNKGKLQGTHSEPHSEGRRPCDGDH